MNYLLFISLIISAALIFAWRVHRSNLDNKKHQQQIATPKQSTKYHAITIQLCHEPCQYVQEFKGKRLLATEAPELPILGCSNQQCTCNYVHHQDRRSGEDRRYPSIAMQDVFSKNEHRFTKNDRRKHHFA
ncbi:hypothetical protein A9Q78_02335 [Methylophaga sp. 41_12_T18]|nr:hypothetical protein A9Q78_02335 [Methylophaga sp. 41_12_T18]